MASVLRAATRRASDSAANGNSSTMRTAVRYTPCSRTGDTHTDEEELDELEVIQGGGAGAVPRGGSSSSAISSASNLAGTRQNTSANNGTKENEYAFNARTGSIADSDATSMQGAISLPPRLTANGPQSLPGCKHSPGTTGNGGERTRAIGERLAGSSSSSRMQVGSPCYSQKDHELDPRLSPSKESSVFEEALSSDKMQTAKANKRVLKDMSHAVYENKAHQLEPVTPKGVRKARRKEIQQRFVKKARTDIIDASTESSEKDGCKWTFVFDPAGRFSYWWSSVVSVAFIFNFWVIIYRFALEEINASNLAVWFTLDYCADFIYVLDIGFHFRTGYLEDGVLQTDGTKLRIHYMNSTMFYIDCLCLLPLDILYLSIGYNSMLRCFRLVKIYRFWAFLDRTERHTNYPNLVRTVTLLHYLFAIYHWNACVIYMVKSQPSSEDWDFSPPPETSMFTKYLHALYYSVNVLTTIGTLPEPKTRGQYVFVIAEFVFGLLLFSAVLGNVANIVTNISAARKDFQARLDSVKTYMSLRRVPLHLQDRVIKWFDYLWLSKKSSNEDKTLGLLPDKLKAEIALYVHLDTLKRVEIFQNTEAGFLCELVLKLRPVLFSPGDYICRKGEVGKEMYIVNRGRLQVVADNGRTILATLRPGSYFGEISILNMGNEGNRRTASVKSVGYSDLFMLSKQDLWEVLKDYPTARVRLEAIAQKRVANYKKAPLEQASMPRSKSTPGLVESAGKIPLQAMLVNRHNTLPTTLLSPQESLESPGESSSHGSSSVRMRGSGMARTGSGTGSGGREGSHTTPGATADTLTHSMTVSSITSYDSVPMPPRVSMATDGTGMSLIASAPAFYAPQSPCPPSFTVPHNNPTMTLLTPSAFRPVDGAQANFYTGLCPPVVNAIGASPIPFSDAPASINSIAQMTLSPMAYLAAPSPCGVMSPNHSLSNGQRGYVNLQHPHPQVAGLNHSTSLSFLVAGTNTMNRTSPTVMTQHFQTLPTNQSAAFLPRDNNNTAQETLLQEISRLQSRLQMLEKENSEISTKLHKQQWNVETRLSEIEMHFCGSGGGSVGGRESSCSLLDDGRLCPHGNRESII